MRLISTPREYLPTHELLALGAVGHSIVATWHSSITPLCESGLNHGSCRRFITGVFPSLSMSAFFSMGGGEVLFWIREH